MTTDPSVHVVHVVVAGVLVRDGRALLCHRHPGRRWYPDVWDLPGGHVEPGEGPVDALVRELREELGVGAEPDPSPLAALRTDDMRLTVLRVPRWAGEPEVVDADEHDDLGWFTVEGARALVLADPAYPALLARALEGWAPGPGRPGLSAQT